MVPVVPEPVVWSLFAVFCPVPEPGMPWPGFHMVPEASVGNRGRPLPRYMTGRPLRLALHKPLVFFQSHQKKKKKKKKILCTLDNVRAVLVPTALVLPHGKVFTTIHDGSFPTSCATQSLVFCQSQQKNLCPFDDDYVRAMLVPTALDRPLLESTALSIFVVPIF